MRALVRGAVNIAAVRELVRAGRPLPYPLERDVDRHDAILKRATIRRLELQGIVRRDVRAGTYQLKPGLELAYHKPLLARLQEGPLPSRDWREVATSLRSLRAQVSQLRKRGYNIVATPDRRPDDRQNGKAPVRYELR
jgi:hypothetical protein